MLVDQASYLGKGFFEFLSGTLRSRHLIFELSRREFRSKYLGSAFGLLWGFVHPAVMTAIYFIVFQFYLNGGPVHGVPLVVFLLAGLVPWFMLNDCLLGGAGVILENRFLVKKVVFRVSLLPLVRVLSMLPVHLFFVVVLVFVFWAYHLPPSWYTLQVVYYLIGMMAFCLGWSWLVSALVPFLKDLFQVVQVLLQIVFWVTAIVWDPYNLPPGYRWMLYVNPLNYIIQGYRESLVYQTPFWSHPLLTAYFWTVTATLCAVGGIVFLRLRAHFADVL